MEVLGKIVGGIAEIIGGLLTWAVIVALGFATYFFLQKIWQLPALLSGQRHFSL